MQNLNVLKTISLSEIVSLCQEQTKRYFQKQSSEGRYCYELFRRALVEKSQQAWHELYQHYFDSVRGWIKADRVVMLGENQDGLINETFAKFWNAVTPEKFATFPELPAVLQYLKLTAASVLADAQRRTKPENDGAALEIMADAFQALDAIMAKELFDQINQRLKDDDEKLVFFAMFTLGMKPKEICDEWSLKFPTVQRVNQIRQNMVDRLSRDDSLRLYFKGE